MKAVLIDTNCILRYLSNDLPEQAKKIEFRFIQAKNKLIKIEIEEVVIVEVLFQLTHWGGLSRKQAATKLMSLLLAPWLETNSKNEIIQTLAIYAKKKIDFVDLFLYCKAKNANKKVLSFDRDFDKLSSRLRLKP